MNIGKIFEGQITVGQLEDLHEQGYDFVIEDGKITQIYWNCGIGCVPIGRVKKNG